ncbi:MAG TPA: hypothetical protein V6D47_01650 [Oscillatoriaceae cyanobacterium]
MPSPIGDFFSNAFRSLARPFAAAQSGITHKLATWGHDVALFGPLAQLGPGVSDKLDQASEKVLLPHSPLHVNVPEPKSFAPLVDNQPTELLQGATALTHPRLPTTFGIHLPTAGDARLDLRAAGPGTDWGTKGSESAVMSVYLDGAYHQDVVLTGGAQETPYALSLGNLPAGDHTVSLRYAPEKSAAGAKGINLGSLTAQSVTYGSSEEKWAADNAPVLIGRNGLANNHNDAPLALYHKFVKNPDGTTTISYSYAYSNEDGGDGANLALEYALYGRSLDMQHVYDVTVDGNGKVLRRQYEGPWHNIHNLSNGIASSLRGVPASPSRQMMDFNGEFDGSHAVLRTETTNNNVTDSGIGGLRFRFPTDNPIRNAADESLLLKRPDFYRISTAEVAREGKIDPKGVGSKPDPSIWGYIKSQALDLIPGKQRQIADPRNYLYVQLEGQGLEKHPLGVRVQLKDGSWHSSDLGNPKARLGDSGWAQAAVRLPPGTKPQDVKAIAYEGGKVVSQGPAYMLDAEFNPQMVEAPSSTPASSAP